MNGRKNAVKFLFLVIFLIASPVMAANATTQIMACPELHLHLFTYDDATEKKNHYQTSIRSCCIKGAYIFMNVSSTYTVITDCVGNSFYVTETPDEIEDMSKQDFLPTKAP